MKSVVRFTKSLNLCKTLSVLATGASLATYVTLVLSLTQKIDNQWSQLERSKRLKAEESAFSPKHSLYSQQVAFVSKIIRLHTPNKQNIHEIATLIVDESVRAGADPLFVAAVVRSESMFRHQAVSSKGAKGLMQIMPATGRYISKTEKIELRRTEDLYDPATNLRLGIAYLKYLDKKFDGNRERVLIAYNWGPGNVLQSLGGTSSPPSHSVSYARNILSAHQKWNSQFIQHVDALSDESTSSSDTLLG